PCLRPRAPWRGLRGRTGSRPARRTAPIPVRLFRAARSSRTRAGPAAAEWRSLQGPGVRCPPPLGGGRHAGAVERGGSLGRPGERENLGKSQNVRYEKDQEDEKADPQHRLDAARSGGKRVELLRKAVDLGVAQRRDAGLRVLGAHAAALERVA